MRGCLDYFIQSSQEEVDENGNPILDDECLMGLLVDFIIGGKMGVGTWVAVWKTES